MTFIKKHYRKFVCVALCLVLMAGFVIAGLCVGNKNGAAADASVRTVSVEQMTYGEKAEALIDRFESYETGNTATSVSFSGDMFASVGEILGFDSLAYQEEEVVKKIATEYDYETNTFYLNVSYYSGDRLLETVKAETEPQYDEQRDDGYLEYESERFYFSETFDVDGLDECVAGVDDAVVLGLGAVLVCGVIVTLAVTPPSVHQEIIRTVTYVVETVVEAVKSFWSWFTSWITRIFTRTRAVQTTTVITTKTPSLEIDKDRIETREITKDQRKQLPKTPYYLAFADPTNNKFYISTVRIRPSQAAAIMAIPMVQPCIGDPEIEMIASVYTMYELSALTVMDKVGYHKDTPRLHPDNKYGIYHYHSKATIKIKTLGFEQKMNRCPHMFFDF